MKIEAEAHMSTETTLVVNVGMWRAAIFEIQDRYRSNGSRRPRPEAVAVRTYELVHPDWNRCYSSTLPVRTAIEYLKQIGVDPTEFVEAILKHEWGPELPPDYTGQRSFL